MEKIQISDRAKIGKLWDEFAAAMTAGDLKRWIDLWTEEGIQMPPETPRRAGRALIRSEMKPSFDLFDMQMAVYPGGIQVLGDMAFTHGLYELVMIPKEGGDKIAIKGKFLTILKKQVDGSWKIAIDCFNNDAPSI